MPDAAAHPNPTPGPASPSPSEARPTFPVEPASPLALPGARASVSSRVLHCPTCGSNYDVRNWAPGLDVACPSCDVALIPPPTVGAIDAVEAMGAPRRIDALEPQGLPFGRYQLLSELGRGGMGVVLKAWDTQLKRVVALKKILAAGDESQIQIERFMREARLAAKLRHPHIVGVLDVGVLEGQHYFTSEFIEGTSLFQHLKGAAPLRQRVGWIRSIADALAYAHAQGVVHRDVKPENILIDAKGRPFITDFGLAKQVQVGDSWAQDVPALTVSGALLGTPAYLSPEQASGRIESITAASDQFALGAVLYQLLAQKLPFDEVGLRDQLNAVMTKDPLAPSRVNPSVHRDLDAIVLKSMEKDPKRRYSDVGEMAADLGRWLDGEPIRARPVAWLGRTWRKAKRNRAVAVLAAGLALSTILGIVVVTWFAVLPRMRAAAAIREQAEARAARREQAVARLALAREALDAGRVEEAVSIALAVVRDGARFAAKGEDLPMGEAHVILGQVARAKGEPSRALAEFYRAFEAGLGTPREAAALVLVAGQLAEMGEDAQAARLFERALETQPSPRDAYLARRGLAFAAFVEGRFDLARRRFLDLGDPAEASAAERAERVNLLELLTVLSGTTRIPLSGMKGVGEIVFVDLEGDRTAEAAAITADGKGVVLFRLAEGALEETGCVEVVAEEPLGLTHLGLLDLDGDGRAELVVGGGRSDPPSGILAVLAVRDGRPVVVARTPLASSLTGCPFAAADLDGDGTVELLVGTAVYERSLRVYRCDLAHGSLELLLLSPLGGDLCALLTRDADANGRAEVWAFVGPWSAFGLTVLETGPGGDLHELARLPLGEVYEVDSSLFEERGEVLLGLGWSEMASTSVPFSVGRRRFETAYRPPGAYCVRWTAGGSLDAVSFETVLPSDPWGGTGYARVLRAGPRTWALTADPVASGEGVAVSLSGTRVWRREGNSWAPLTRFAAHISEQRLRSFDFDGDGEQELYTFDPDVSGRTWGTLRIHGLGRAEEDEPSGSTPVAAASTPHRTVPAALALARETERVGLWESAWDGYTRVLAMPTTEEDAEEAALGLIRCGVAQGRLEAMVATLFAAMDRFPTIAPRLGRALADACDDAGHWGLALQSIEKLLASPGLPSRERERLMPQRELLLGLAHPATSFDASKEIATCDLLASSPLAARIGEQGVISVYGSSAGLRQLLVPIEYDGTAWRLSASIETPRHEWAIDVEFGLGSGLPASTVLGGPYAPRWENDPWCPSSAHGLWMAAEGRTAHPTRSWTLLGPTARGFSYTRLRSRVPSPLAATGMEIEFAPHQRVLRAGGVQIEEILPLEQRGYIVLGTSGRVATSAYVAELHFRELKLEGSGGRTRALAFTPRDAAEHVLLANGRYLQGRLSEARQTYDVAIALGDAEAKTDAARVQLGLRGLLTEEQKRVPVDGRFWRALLRAEGGDAAGAQADLADAAGRDRERIEWLMASFALPLRDHPIAIAALRDFLGEGRSISAEALGQEVFDALGFPLAETLLAGTGVRALRRPRVLGVGQGACGLAAGDVIETVDGGEVDGAIAFDAVIGDANNEGKERIVVRVMRGGAPIEVPMGLPGPKVETEDVVLFVADPKR